MFNSDNEQDFSDSAALYEACCSVDPDIRDAAYKKLWKYLYRVALQIVRNQLEAEAMAQDFAQDSLIRIHQRLSECREPAAFRTWARRIVSRMAIDELRRRKRLVPPDEDDAGSDATSSEDTALETISLSELYSLINQAPTSARSRRVILGRYRDDMPDERLAQIESELTGRPVRPSHLQVTRAKNIDKLRGWGPLLSFLETI